MTIYYSAGDRTPFTYVITHNKSGKRYYGARYKKGCIPSDLWESYFTSSEIIQELINQDGKGAFSVEVRKTFTSVEQCLAWETSVLRKLNARDSDKWLNKHNGGKVFYNTSPASEKTRAKMAKVRKGKPKSDSMKQNSMWYYELRFDSGEIEYIKGKVNVLQRLKRKDWDTVLGAIARKGGYLQRSKVTISRMDKKFQPPIKV